MTQLRELTSVRKSAKSQSNNNCVGCEWIIEQPEEIVYVDTKNLLGNQVPVSACAHRALLAWLKSR